MAKYKSHHQTQKYIIIRIQIDNTHIFLRICLLMLAYISEIPPILFLINIDPFVKSESKSYNHKYHSDYLKKPFKLIFISTKIYLFSGVSFVIEVKHYLTH